MKILDTFAGFIRRMAGRKEYAVHEKCAFCGERVYLPFLCPHCRKYFCGNHHLPFHHACTNIDDWKNSGNRRKK